MLLHSITPVGDAPAPVLLRALLGGVSQPGEAGREPQGSGGTQARGAHRRLTPYGRTDSLVKRSRGSEHASTVREEMRSTVRLNGRDRIKTVPRPLANERMSSRGVTMSTRTLDYRRGFRRIFGILAVLWVFTFLVGFPLYERHRNNQQAIAMETYAMRRDAAGYLPMTRADTQAEIGRPYRERATAFALPNWWRYLLSELPLTLAILFGPLAAVYALTALVVWIGRGFKKPVPPIAD